MLRQAEEIGLGQHHGPQLACPLVKPREEIAVEGLQMGQVVLAGDQIGGELQPSQEREVRFELLELVAIADVPHVAQDVGVRVDVWIVAHMCRDAPFAAAEVSKPSSGLPVKRRRSASLKSASEASPRTQRSASSRTGPVGSRPSRRSDPATLAAIWARSITPQFYRLEPGHQLHQVALGLVAGADFLDVGVEVLRPSALGV